MQIPVRSFTAEADGRRRQLVSLADISEAFDPSVTPSPPKKPITFTAIWDTGATNTVITQKVVDACQLKPTGMAKTQTAKGEMMTPTYLISIGLPNKVGISQLRVTKGSIAGNAEVLIGMDIISAGDFAVTNKGGKTTFSFRLPSTERIDFVEQMQPAKVPQISRSFRKVGRNDPCPCGSGKKYKKCCGK